MHSIDSGAADISYSDRPPVLVAASSDAAAGRAERAIAASGLRVGAVLPIEQASSRVALQPSASAVWVELDRDCGGPVDDLLTRVSDDVANGRYAAVVSATGGLLDSVAASVGQSDVELIVDADDAERAAALAIATARAGMPLRVADAATDRSAARLRQLSDEVSRIASTLARLSTGPSSVAPIADPLAGALAEVPSLSAETVRAVIRARRLRSRYFPDELFADPAWDMLLDLLQAEIAQLRVPVSSLCIAAAVPATTALRWLKTMVAEGLFLRRADPHDGRRVFVDLAPAVSQALRRYFAEVGSVPVI
jgi:hypothetical protein